MATKSFQQSADPILSFSATPAQPLAPKGFGHVIRQREPDNFEFPFAALSGLKTPNELFYVRNHFKKPTLDTQNLRLKIEGCVDTSIEFTFEELLRLRPHTRMITLECAGNGRVLLTPKENGAQWELGAVSTAEWTGVLLSDVLAQVGLKGSAREIIFEGADKGHPDETPKPPGEIHYARAIPVSKISDTLLAYQMNGKPLPAAHGAPLRAVVGGWYGMASVKWLSRIVVSEEPFHGYFQTIDYSYWEDQAGMPIRVPITHMMVKAQIARPVLHEAIPVNGEYQIAGAAWAGDSDVIRVEISTDGGKSYAQASLLGDPIRHAWRLWQYNWRTPSSPGTHTLIARATDATRNAQPPEHDKRFGSYMISHPLPVEVEVV